jgi:hypothetical protein
MHCDHSVFLGRNNPDYNLGIHRAYPPKLIAPGRIGDRIEDYAVAFYSAQNVRPGLHVMLPYPTSEDHGIQAAHQPRKSAYRFAHTAGKDLDCQAGLSASSGCRFANRAHVIGLSG